MLRSSSGAPQEVRRAALLPSKQHRLWSAGDQCPCIEQNGLSNLGRYEARTHPSKCWLLLSVEAYDMHDALAMTNLTTNDVVSLPSDSPKRENCVVPETRCKASIAATGMHGEYYACHGYDEQI